MDLNENVGKTIGIYNILDICDHCTNDRHKLYYVECIFCGWKGNMRTNDVKYATKCTHIDKHGNYKTFNSFQWSNKRLGNIFNGMKVRCYNPNHKNYRWYGAKGIRICNEWIKNPQEFEVWAFANGYKDNLTIDRIDESKSYSPDNCRWINLGENSKYKSTTSLINVDGETHSGKDWSKILGFSPNVINKYVVKYGLSNTIEFIYRYKKNPTLQPKHKQSYYDLYMNENTILT